MHKQEVPFSSIYYTLNILFYELFSNTLEILFLFFVVDTPLAFTITVVTWVADSTFQSKTQAKKDTQSDLDTWCGKKWPLTHSNTF